MSTLVLVEFLEDVPSALRLAQSSGATLVALTPEAMEALDGAAQKFEPWTTRRQCERDDLLASESLSRVATLADCMTPRKPNALSIASCHAHDLHALFCSVAFRALALHELVERFAPTEIIGFQPLPMPADGLLFRPYDP